MDRLTTDKPVSEMGMVGLAYNSCFAKDGEAYYRDFSEEISARNLARILLKKYADGDDAFTCNDDFDDEMIELLQYGTETIEGLIALFYRNLWAMADLRETLKRYEDLGTVEEFQQAKEKQTAKNPNYEGDGHYNGELVLDTWICPNCGKSYEVDYDDYDYCPNCGQHIDHSGLTEDGKG